MTPDADDMQTDGTNVRMLVTADEAFPAFEDAVLDARHRIEMGFRVFDFSTPLRGARAQTVGRDWFDLLLDALRRGVAVRLVLSDFDPIIGEALHAATWRSRRIAMELAELAPPDARLDVQSALHPARVAWPISLVFWPQVQRKLRRICADLRDQSDAQRDQYLRDRPGLAHWLCPRDGVARPRLWIYPELRPVTHHHKIAVFDGAKVYCGGLDLNNRRFDTKRHDRPSHDTWQDVQVMVDRADVARSASAHLATFVSTTETGQGFAPADGKFLRTVSRRRDRWGHPLAPVEVLTEIETALLDGISRARRYIYIESQYLRDRRITAALCAAARRVPDLTAMMVLPGAPDDVAFERNGGLDARYGEFLQARCIRSLNKAFGKRVAVLSPVRPVEALSEGRNNLHGAPLIYLHSKVFLVDDLEGIVGNANLNGRSLRWDTEVAVRFAEAAQVRRFRERLLQHWGDGQLDPRALGPDTFVEHWRDVAERNARLPADKRHGFLVRHDVGPGRVFGRDLPGVPEEMV